MTKTQAAKFSSYNRIVNFLFAYSALFTGLIRLLKCAADFKAAFAALKVLLPSSTATKSSPATIIKNRDFSNMIDTILSLANRAYLFAVDTSNETLLATFQAEKNDFYVLVEAEKILLAQNILAAINSNSALLIAGYDITAVELTAAGADITAAQALIASPSTIIGNNKTSNEEIDATFLLVDQSVLLLEKSIYGRFKSGVSAKLSLISNFDSAKKLRGLTKHTALLANIVNAANEPLVGVSVEIEINGLIKSATTNLLGIAEIEKFLPGTYNVTYAATGYIPQTIPTTFTLGDTHEVSVILLKVI
jgi:hypothetical protein